LHHITEQLQNRASKFLDIHKSEKQFVKIK